MQKTLNPDEYVEQMALLLDLQLDPEHRPACGELSENCGDRTSHTTEFLLSSEIEAGKCLEP